MGMTLEEKLESLGKMENGYPTWFNKVGFGVFPMMVWDGYRKCEVFEHGQELRRRVKVEKVLNGLVFETVLFEEVDTFEEVGIIKREYLFTVRGLSKALGISPTKVFNALNRAIPKHYRHAKDKVIKVKGEPISLRCIDGGHLLDTIIDLAVRKVPSAQAFITDLVINGSDFFTNFTLIKLETSKELKRMKFYRAAQEQAKSLKEQRKKNAVIKADIAHVENKIETLRKKLSRARSSASIRCITKDIEWYSSKCDDLRSQLVAA